MSLRDDIISVLKTTSGYTDRELTNLLKGTTFPQQSINQACRQLQNKGVIKRINRKDGLIGNFLNDEV